MKTPTTTPTKALDVAKRSATAQVTDSVFERLAKTGQAAAPDNHPVRRDTGVTASASLFFLRPDLIEKSGPYIRHHVDQESFQELVASIRATGQVEQAIGIREEGKGLQVKRVLVYGMRRWMAAKEVGLTKIPVRNYGNISVDEALHLQLLENEVRSRQHVVDTALAYHDIWRRNDQQARRVQEVTGKSAGTVSEMIQLGSMLVQISDTDREALYHSANITYRALREILAQAPEAPERIRRVLALAHAPAAAHDGPARLPAPPKARGGRKTAPTLSQRANARGTAYRFQLAWTKSQVAADPAAFQANLEALLSDIKAAAERSLAQVQGRRSRAATAAPGRPRTATPVASAPPAFAVADAADVTEIAGLQESRLGGGKTSDAARFKSFLEATGTSLEDETVSAAPSQPARARPPKTGRAAEE